MNKIKPIFLFMVKNETNISAAKIIKTQLTLNKYIQLYPHHEVKNFTDLEEAQSFINLNNYPSIDAKMVKSSTVPEEPKGQSTNTTTLKTSIEKPKKSPKPQDDPLELSDSPISDPAYQQQDLSFLFKYYTENNNHIVAAAKKILNHNIYHLMFDGASKSNPGPSGAGFTILDTNGKSQIYNGFMHTGFKTNNQAEYLGLLYGLKTAINIGIKRLNVYGDSQLIIYQMNNIYRVKNSNIISYNQGCRKLCEQFEQITFQHVKREYNSIADELANKGVSAYKKKPTDNTVNDKNSQNTEESS